MDKKLEIAWSHCNRCGRKTKNTILASRELLTVEAEDEDFGPLIWQNSYNFLECAGCESVSMMHSSKFEDTGEIEVTVYPPPVKRHKPHWFYHHLPTQVRLLLQQVYQALDGDSRSLALMGARAVLDMVLVDSVGDKGTFAEKLNELEKNGFIGSKNRETLEAALDAGNAASHRGYIPSSDDMNAVMDIVENLLQAKYHLNILAERLKKTTPARPKKKKDSSVC